MKITDEERARQERIAARPPLSEILNLHDFEVCLCDWQMEYALTYFTGHCEIYYARESMGLLLLSSR